MEPGVKPAAEQTRSGIVGVLATEASIAGEKFHQLVDTHADGVRVITRPCPKFVELVEAGKLDGPEVDAAIDEAVAPMLDAGADALVLGCTHYPFLSPAIRSRIPESVSLIDTGPAAARRVAELLPKVSDSSREKILKFISKTTGELSVLEELFPMLLPGFEAELTQSPLTSAEG